MESETKNSGVVSVSVVIPAYNESAVIADTLHEICEFLSPMFGFEIIVVDDAGIDGTHEAVEAFAQERENIHVLRNLKNRGKGYCVRSGVARAAGELVLVSDADLSVPIKEIVPFIERIEQGSDIVIASRYLEGSTFLYPRPVKQAMGRIFNLMVRVLFGFRYRDTQCGFKLMRAGTAKKIFSECRVDRFAFDVELLLRAKDMGAKVFEHPVYCANSPHSKVRVLRDSLNMMKDIIALRFSSRKGR